MIRLPDSVAAWPSANFADTLKRELEQQPAAALPLQAGLSSSSYAFGDRFSAMVIRASDEGASIGARVGIFYEGITAGCNCADDPTPVEPQPEYCEIELSIEKATALASLRLAQETPA
jgi:hypothetical protein